MMNLKHVNILVPFLSFIVLSVYIVAGQPVNFEARGPDIITTTIGELVELRIDITNKGPSTETYTVTISAINPNIVDIRSPSMTTGPVRPNQITSVSTNIRALTDESNTVSVDIRSGSESKVLNIPLRAKKFSLSEFGFLGFIQIMVVSAALYFARTRH